MSFGFANDFSMDHTLRGMFGIVQAIVNRLIGPGRAHGRAVCTTHLQRLALLAAALLVAIVGLRPAAADSVRDFYAGKQVTIIVGSGAGGGYDLQARLTARHLGKHVPGNPTFIVQNMPGAGSLQAANYIYNSAPADGTTIALLQRGMLLIKLINPSGVRFEIDKLHWIGSLNSEVGVVLSWHTTEHKTTRDLFDKELIVGGIVGVDPETTPRLLNALIGTRFKIVNGYNTTAQIALAIERNEVQGIADWSWSSVKAVRPDWLRDRKAHILMQVGLHKEPELPDVPSALDFVKDAAERKVMELNFTQKTAARPLVAPPGVPAERVAALRAAFAALATDAEFLADAERSKLEIAPLPAEAVDKVIALIASTPPEIADHYAKVLSPAARTR
ncbi:MAG: Bug family tripartite tricarboxylate transporter substrate binding protein [Xanthobacteraceae bacterium]